MTFMATDTETTTTVIDTLGNAGEGTCDKAYDPLKDIPEFAGRAVWTCRKPANHDKRGAHLMVDAQGRKTSWRGADNE